MRAYAKFDEFPTVGYFRNRLLSFRCYWIQGVSREASCKSRMEKLYPEEETPANSSISTIRQMPRYGLKSG